MEFSNRLKNTVSFPKHDGLSPRAPSPVLGTWPQGSTWRPRGLEKSPLYSNFIYCDFMGRGNLYRSEVGLCKVLRMGSVRNSIPFAGFGNVTLVAGFGGTVRRNFAKNGFWVAEGLSLVSVFFKASKYCIYTVNILYYSTHVIPLILSLEPFPTSSGKLESSTNRAVALQAPSQESGRFPRDWLTQPR